MQPASSESSEQAGNRRPCRHPRQKHTVWWWIEDRNDPVPAPYSATFDNRADAVEFATEGLERAEREGQTALRWVKVFRADNEQYECFHWDNPVPHTPPQTTAALPTVEACSCPIWCHRPFLRGFVMANALAAPVFVILWAVLS